MGRIQPTIPQVEAIRGLLARCPEHGWPGRARVLRVPLRWPLRRRRPRMAAARSGRPVAWSEAPRLLDLVKGDTGGNDGPLTTLGIKAKDAVMTATTPGTPI